MRLVCGESKILTPFLQCPGFLLIGLTLLQCSVLMTVGIKIGNVSVPAVGTYGQSVNLLCEFLLEKDESLYSLKWYKAGDDGWNEFFRYTPNSKPTMVTFPFSGVQVDKQHLSVNRSIGLTLRQLSLLSSGIYRCEVSSDHFFQTLFRESNLTVIIPPNPANPKLSKFKSTVYMRDMINGTCTSYKSFPAANLSFYLNGEKCTGSNVTVYEPVSEIGRDGHTEVWTSVLDLRLRVESNHFYKGAIRIKCVAEIFGNKWHSEKIITHKNYQHSGHSGHRYSSSSSGFLASKSRSWCWWNYVGPSTFTLSTLSLPFIHQFMLILFTGNVSFF